jgi:hypothetical protein
MVNLRASRLAKTDPKTRRKINTIVIWTMAVVTGLTALFMYLAIQREIRFLIEGRVVQGTIVASGETHCSAAGTDGYTIQTGDYIVVEYTTITGTVETSKIDDCDVSSPYIKATISGTLFANLSVPVRYLPDDPSHAEVDGMATSKIQLYLWIAIAGLIACIVLVIWGFIRQFRRRKSDVLASSVRRLRWPFCLRGCVQRLQELFCAIRLSMSRIMARQIQASSLLGSSS